jgi:hypothetical protein
MPVTDPDSGLEFYELSHPWGMYTPIFPGYEEIKLERITYHAKQGAQDHDDLPYLDARERADPSRAGSCRGR